MELSLEALTRPHRFQVGNGAISSDVAPGAWSFSGVCIEVDQLGQVEAILNFQ